MKIVECIPNFSEARRPEVMAQIKAAVEGVAGVRVLDQHSDLDHNRTVLTFVGEPEAVEAAAFAGIVKAAELIDLNQHQGEHPRIGATDVVPFVPISDVTMAECVEMAKRLAAKVAGELNIPVYLYEEAAVRADRRNLEDIRRGEYEGLKEAIASDPYKQPDFGPMEVGSAGATVIGARQPLIAYNVFLNTADVSIAEKIARRVRHSTGGFRYVKAMGVLVDGLAQVSMNLTNFKRSPMAQVTEMIRREAERYGVGVHHTELVGLIPNQALMDAAQYYLQLDAFEKDQVLESKVFGAAADGAAEPEDFISQVAAGTPAPGGGSAAAHSGAVAAALVQMVCRLTIGKSKYADVQPEMESMLAEAGKLEAQLREAVVKDAESFDGILVARRLPKGTEEEKATRDEAIHKATLYAAQVPLENAHACRAVMSLALKAAEKGNINTISDAAAGAHLAKAGLDAALLNVRLNLSEMTNDLMAFKYLTEAEILKEEGNFLEGKIEPLLKSRAGL